MANYIDFQLKVEGTRERLQQLQDLIVNIHYDSDEYSINLEPLMQGRKGVLSKKRISEMDLCESELEKFFVLEDFTKDFNFQYSGSYTFYDWHGNGRVGELAIWNEYFWQRVSINENSLIVNVISKWSPPIVNIISGSKLFPDLNFRLSFHDISDELHPWGSVEGRNGIFAEPSLNYYMMDRVNDKRVYTNDNINWFYVEDQDSPVNLLYISRCTDELYDKSEPNYTYGTMENTKVIYNNLKENIIDSN
jgi:hypothetical protein